MNAKVVKLHFECPVHFGAGRLTDGEYACDAATLFSAMFIEAIDLGRADELLQAARSGTLAISDAFPFIGNDYYVPKPLIHTRQFDDLTVAETRRGDSRSKKAFKKLKYIRASRLEDFISGQIDPLDELGAFKLGVSALRTSVNLERKEADDAKPYGVGGFSFYPGNGLYFITSGSYDLRPIMDQLQYSGLGGKRSSGYGLFSYRIVDDTPVSLADSAASEQAGKRSFMLMSTAVPAECELTDGLLKGACYRLLKKGGFVQSRSHLATAQKKREVYAFSSGSTFEHRFDGDILDVNETPESHPVYRYARALWAEA